jgi:site-specific DNA-methyltransferase (adenine-specific)
MTDSALQHLAAAEASSDSPVSEFPLSDTWATPWRLFRAASERFGPFTLDVAALPWNAKAPRYFTPLDDGLAQSWRGRVWCNPPYSRGNLEAWTAKAYAEVEARRAQLVTCLVPAWTSDGWWHRHVLPPRSRGTLASGEVRALVGRVHVTVRFLRGRVRFETEAGPAKTPPFASALVVYAIAPSLGRPRVLTPETVARVETLLAKGHSTSNACRLAGVDRRTWYRHLTRRRPGSLPSPH